MKSLSEMAPIKLDVDDSMLVAVQQILWFKTNGFSLTTVRALVGLEPKIKPTWDETCEEMAELWEAMRDARHLTKTQA